MGYFRFPALTIDTTGLATDANQLTIIGHIDGVEAALTTIDGHIDGIETLLADQATAANQATIIGHIDGLEALITAIDGHIDGIETLLADQATAANQTTIIGYIDAIEANLTTIIGHIDTLEAGLASIIGHIDGIEGQLTTLLNNTKLLSVVDFMDTPVLDASVTTINGSAGEIVSVVASLAADTRSIKVADTTGEFIGIYDDGTLVAIVNPGQDSEIPVSIAATSVIGVRSMNAANITVGSLCLQFLG